MDILIAYGFSLKTIPLKGKKLLRIPFGSQIPSILIFAKEIM
jgi:hypothetical protein